ncbi:MAG: TonB-dependent receptor plug domain-containing protein, partial [Flavobacteriaceae bacterium]
MRTFLAVLTVLPLVLYAQQPKKQDSITPLGEVILYDDLLQKNVTGIVPSEVIGPKTFNDYSPADLISAVNQIPGVLVLSGALNTNRITIRGVGSRTPYGTNKLRMYYNNIPITDGGGSSTIEAFDLENMGSVEISKGPKATAYGALLGGAIILNPKRPLENETVLRNNFTAGSWGLIKNNLAFFHKDDKISLDVHYGHLQTDGYRENSRFERNGVMVGASFQLDKSNSLSLLVNHIDYMAQIPSSISQTAMDEDPTQAAFTWKMAQGFEDNNFTLTAISHEHRFHTSLKSQMALFYTYLDHYEPRPFNILDEFT